MSPEDQHKTVVNILSVGLRHACRGERQVALARKYPDVDMQAATFEAFNMTRDCMPEREYFATLEAAARKANEAL